MGARLLDLRVILLAAAALRLAWLLAVPMVLFSDPLAYMLRAENLVEHGVYGFEPDVPHATWPPGTSFLYAPVYLLPLPETLTAKSIGFGVSLLNVWLAFVVGSALFGDRAGRVTAWIMALWPQMVYFTTLPASEPPFIAALLAGVFFWHRARARGAGRDILIAGLLIGVACYFRTVALLLPLALMLSDILRGAVPPGRAVVRTVAAMLVMAVVIAPWTLRNYLAFGEFMLMSSNFNANLYMGNAGGSTGRFGSAEFPEGLETKGDPDRSEKLGELARREIIENPGAFLRRSLSKIRIVHDRETIGVAWNQKALGPLVGERGMTALKALASGYWWLVLAGGLAAIPWHLLRGAGWRIVVSIPLAVWGYFATVHAVILAGDRFHMPQAAFVAMLAASMIAGTRRRDHS